MLRLFSTELSKTLKSQLQPTTFQLLHTSPDLLYARKKRGKKKSSPFQFVEEQAPSRDMSPLGKLMREAKKLEEDVADAERPFDKILIANRGEIACRVIRTAKKMGIKTVAVYSDADTYSPHVQQADEAVRIGPPPSTESYLLMDKIIDVCKQTGAQAVHPGYGFLSENHHFVEKLEANDIAFIGPGSHAITAMGDKIESKKIALEAKVNTIPGFAGKVEDSKHAVKIANEIGYPVMIKASAGGGGKGMRVAWNDKETVEGFRLSKAEAASSFGDDTILIEKFIDKPRHVEIQILCDGENFLYLPERECSIQRRNQKVIEEAPSPFIDKETRRKMGEQAVSLARAVGYKSAGTVEFLVDSGKDFYFLEMNTRLQVEHPITELITGLDLVKHMIEVAAGMKLPITQDEIIIKGWAIESRVYAEDPLRGFLPSIGRLKTYFPPLSSKHVRIDSGVEEGSQISIYYDPLISKLSSWGKNREAAINYMCMALDTYVVRGVNNNINFLRDVMENETFIDGNITTNFIPGQYPDGFKGHKLVEEEREYIGLIACCLRQLQDVRIQASVNEIVENVDTIFTYYIGEEDTEGTDVEVSIEAERETEVVFTTSGENAKKVEFPRFGTESNIVYAVIDDEIPVVVQIVNRETLGYKIIYSGTEYDVKVLYAREISLLRWMPKIQKLDTKNALLSPMAGTLKSVAVKPGDKVVLGQELAVVEAMKMQNVLKAEHAGIVKSVLGEVDKSIGLDEIILEFESGEKEGENEDEKEKTA